VVSTEPISLHREVAQLVKEFSTLYELQIFVILECDTALEFTKSSEEPAVSVPVMFYLVASHHNPKDSKLHCTVTIQRTANTVHNTYHNPIHIPTPTPIILSLYLTQEIPFIYPCYMSYQSDAHINIK
jgi:hypothetical protein